MRAHDRKITFSAKLGEAQDFKLSQQEFWRPVATVSCNSDTKAISTAIPDCLNKSETLALGNRSRGASYS